MSTELDFKNSRLTIPVLVVTSNSAVMLQMKHALKSLGFNSVSSAQTHIQGADRFLERQFPLVIFDAKPSDMPSIDFVHKLMMMDKDVCLIPFSAEPRVDDVFGLLRAGARHFISLPFDAGTVEEIILSAAEGPPLSENVLNSPDRNSALAGLILNCLYRVTVLQRQVRDHPRWSTLLEREQAFLSEATYLAKLFCEGSEEALQERIVEGCVARSEMAATRIGRTRLRLRNQREKRNSQKVQERLTTAAADAIRR